MDFLSDNHNRKYFKMNVSGKFKVLSAWRGEILLEKPVVVQRGIIGQIKEILNKKYLTKIQIISEPYYIFVNISNPLDESDFM